MKMSWQLIALAAITVTAVTILAALHVDASIILAALAALGIGGVAGMVNQVRDNTNGNQARMLALYEQMVEKLHNSTPIIPNTTMNSASTTVAPPADAPPAETEDTQK